MIELPERRAADILNEFNNDYESMASSLQVMNKRLVLLNPVSKMSYLSPFFIFLFACRNSLIRRGMELRQLVSQEDHPYLHKVPSLIWVRVKK